MITIDVIPETLIFKLKATLVIIFSIQSLNYSRKVYKCLEHLIVLTRSSMSGDLKKHLQIQP